jgi:hypothetical protein
VFLTRRTTEVLLIRKMGSGIDYAMTLRFRYRPRLLGRLFGVRETFDDHVYIGNHVWRSAATGNRVDVFYESWLDELLKSALAREAYKKDTEVEE